MRLISGYTAWSPNELHNLGQAVAQNLPGLPVFATLKPTPAEIAAAAAGLGSAINMEGAGRKQAIAAAFSDLCKLLRGVAINAPQMANVTDTDLAEIGLPKAKVGVRLTTVPDAPQNLRLRHSGLPGEVRGLVDSMGRNIRGYVSQWTLDPNAGPWIDGGQFPNSRVFLWKGLARGKDIWVRVAAINSVGQGPWSDPATIMVI